MKSKVKNLFYKPTRVFPSLISHEIVSVQPMSQPSSLMFYLDYKYDVAEQTRKEILHKLDSIIKLDDEE